MDLGHLVSRLKAQVSRAELVLFTGAGFSANAYDRSGTPLPSAWQLKKELWALCYPEAPFDESAPLADLYDAARRRKSPALTELLERRLLVDADSLPEFYRTYFDLPWLRCYTLNIDDLERAIARRFVLQRLPTTISATSKEFGTSPCPRPNQAGLEVVHLNGVLPSSPEDLTFSESQYAERIASQEPWYARCVADLTCRPVIFIGTAIAEPLFWQHMELRRRRDVQGRDLRPGSILVASELSPPRQEILSATKLTGFPALRRTSLMTSCRN